MIHHWMSLTGIENPFFKHYNVLLDIACEHDVTLSLGDALRPGCIEDSTDKPQLNELKLLGKLAARSVKVGVQTIIEGPGHVPLHEVEKNLKLQQKYCKGVPFYVLGPIVTDIAFGYDHITSAIGGAIAAWHGAAFLCYVTPAEHLSLPSLEDVKEGIIASRIAAHVADIAKGIPKSRQWDNKVSDARKNLDWESLFKLSLDPKKARDYRKKSGAHGKECSMCGEYCALKVKKCG